MPALTFASAIGHLWHICSEVNTLRHKNKFKGCSAPWIGGNEMFHF